MSFVLLSTLTLSYLPALEGNPDRDFLDSDLVAVTKCVAILRDARADERGITTISYFATLQIGYLLKGCRPERDEIRVLMGSYALGPQENDALLERQMRLCNTQPGLVFSVGQIYIVALTPDGDSVFRPRNYWRSVFRVNPRDHSVTPFLPDAKHPDRNSPLSFEQFRKRFQVALDFWDEHGHERTTDAKQTEGVKPNK